MNRSTRDMVRLGLLMQRGGNWNGKQIIPGALPQDDLDSKCVGQCP
jgi:CubicO group peptidase (beta-lactamase class C family)